MARRPRITIDLSGPFFAHDPTETFRGNVHRANTVIAEEGAKAVRQALAVGEASRRPIGSGVQPDRVSEHVVGRTHALAGKPWAATAVVSINNSGFSAREGIALMAAASRVEAETRAFRRTARAFRRLRPEIADHLLDGLQ